MEVKVSKMYLLRSKETIEKIIEKGYWNQEVADKVSRIAFNTNQFKVYLDESLSNHEATQAVLDGINKQLEGDK